MKTPQSSHVYTSRGSYVFIVEGLDALGSLDALDPEIIEAARQAVNRTVDRARTRSAEEIRRQVNFPAGYLSGDDSRLKVTQRATNSRLEAVISGRRRPTSLARFVVNSSRAAGTSVSVHPGSVKRMQRAFLMKLRRGKLDISQGHNVGLAIRTDGEAPKRAYKPIKISEELYLLYGPSVDQVFRTVREDVSKDTEEFLQAEFNRLLGLKK